MDRVIEILVASFSGLSWLDLGLLTVNSLLLLFSRWIIQNLFQGGDESDAEVKRIHMFRVANLLLLLSVLLYNFFLPLAGHSWITRVLSALLVGYLGYLGFHLINYLIKKRFGREHEISGKRLLADTYNSRVLSLISAVFMFIFVLIAVVQIFGFDSLLKAGGVIGFVGVFLALTQGSWAPDIISGMIILNSRLVEEGDVIEFADGSNVTGMVFKTKVFHTEILNLVNNHRIMIQNSRLRQQTIHNLSKFASARGLREVLRFKIGYDVDQATVRKLFEAAYERVEEDPDIPIETDRALEVHTVAAGDYAIEWSVYYYTKDVKRLLQTRHDFLELILQQAYAGQISLATPILHQAAADN